MTKEQMFKEYQDAINVFCKELNLIDEAHETYLELICRDIRTPNRHGELLTPIQYKRFIAIDCVHAVRGANDPHSKVVLP